MKSSRHFFFHFLKLAAVFLLAGTAAPEVYAGLKINLVAVNASQDQSKDYPIKYYLPRELKPEDILDPGGLTLDYDPDKQLYYVSGTITLTPKESKTIKIDVNDVWKISKDQVDAFKKQIDENLARIENTANYETGKTLKASLEKQLDNILAEQENFSGNIERRIEGYRSHVDEMKSIKDKIFSVEYWEGKTTRTVKQPTESGKTVKFMVDVENPRENEAKSIKQQHYLPSEIKPEDIVDAKGFEVRYDAEKKQSYLAKEEDFAPGEKKHYEIEIRDVWTVAQEAQKSMGDRAKDAYSEIEKSNYGKEYMNSAKSLLQEVDSSVEEIEKLQSEKKSVKQHIGAYRVNQKRLEQAEEDIKRLESILALVRQKRLEELEKSKVRNVLQKLQSLKGIESVSKAVFGQKPTIGTTWRTIGLTIIFIAIYTVIHFLIWWQRSKAAKLKELERLKTAKVEAK